MGNGPVLERGIMEQVIYPGPLTGVVLPDGTVCEKDKPVAVRKDVAANLINQGFRPAKEKDGANK